MAYTVVRPAKHLFEDETLLLVYIPNKLYADERPNNMTFVEKMRAKQWIFWSSFTTSEGRYMMFIKKVIAIT